MYCYSEQHKLFFISQLQEISHRLNEQEHMSSAYIP